MECQSLIVVSPTPIYPRRKLKEKVKRSVRCLYSRVQPDPWSLSDGTDPTKPKPKHKNPKNPLSDDNARRIIKAKARYLSVLRRNQGSGALTPKWIKRTPEQMVNYLNDDRQGHLYGRHVVAAVKAVRAMDNNSNLNNLRMIMSTFVTKLSFRDMCVVLKEQKGWRQASLFFAWMKLQLCYRPSVIVYTILLRLYGQVGKIKLAEMIFLEMLEAGCEPDEVACGTMLCTYARWGRHKPMLTFYSAVQERGIVPSIAVFNFMLSSLHKKGFHDKVIDIWRQMIDKRVAANNFTYTLVISSFVKQGHHYEALKTFYEMRNTSFTPEEITYSHLISSCTRNAKWNEALAFYDDMRSKGIVPSNYTCASLLTLFYKTEDYSKALSLFSEMEKFKIAADEVIYGLLIRIYGKLGLYEDAEKMFEETEQLGLLGDEKTFLAMAQVHLNSGNADKALTVIEVMKSKNIWLSRFAYIVLLQCYVMKEDLCSAEVSFQALSKTGLPDAGACNDMLNLYLRLDLTNKAKDFIARIRKDQVEFNEELYKTVMRLYSKEGMIEVAKELAEDMGENGSFKNNKFTRTVHKIMLRGKMKNEQYIDELVASELDSVAIVMILNMYIIDGKVSSVEEILMLLLEIAGSSRVLNQVVKKFIREGDISTVGILYNQLRKLGCVLEDDVIASLICFYGNQKMLKEAQDVFQAVFDFSRPSKLILKSIIDTYTKCGEPEWAYSVYEEVTRKGLDLDPIAISVLVNALTNCGRHKETETVIRNSFRDSLNLDTIAYNTFIKAMLEAGKLQFAASIYKRMLSLVVPTTIRTYNTMISVYGRSQKLDKALEMLNTARSLGHDLDEKAYMNLISYYGKAGKAKEASVLFYEMQEEGIKPGLVSYNIMSNVCAAAGLDYEAEKLFQAMQRDGLSPDPLTYLSLIQAYAKSLKYTKAEETIDSMQKQCVPLSCSHFNTLLSALLEAGQIIEAKRVFKKLFVAGLNPDVACYRTLFKGYMEWGCVEDGIECFEQIRGSSVEQDKFILSAVVHLYKSAGKEAEAQNILELMTSLRIPFLKSLEVGSKVKPS